MARKTVSPALQLYRKTGRRRMQPEASLQITVAEHLRLMATPGTWFLSIPNERKCSPAMGKQLKDMGLLPGAADLLIFRFQADPIWLELKAKDGKPSVEQLAFRDLVKSAGHIWISSNEIRECLATLRILGALKPEVKFRRAA
jgi:hypothetical protein